MNTIENACLIEARDFLEQARKATGFLPRTIIPDVKMESEGSMLGHIAAQRYDRCVSKHTTPQKSLPSR